VWDAYGPPTRIERSAYLFDTAAGVLSARLCLHQPTLKQAVLEHESSQLTYTDREVVGWSSPHDMSMMEWAGEPLKHLFDAVTQVAELATESSGRTGKTAQHPHWQVVEILSNVQRSGGINGYHAHPGSF